MYDVRTRVYDNTLHVVCENLCTSSNIRKGDSDVPVKAAGSNESTKDTRRIQYAVSTVGKRLTDRDFRGSLSPQ